MTYVLREEVAVAHSRQYENKCHQCHCPLPALPGRSRIPYTGTCEGDDITACLTARTEEYHEEQHRGKEGFAEGKIPVLPATEVRQGEEHHAREDEPQVGIVHIACRAAYQTQQGDVLCKGMDVLRVLSYEAAEPFVILPYDVGR